MEVFNLKTMIIIAIIIAIAVVFILKKRVRESKKKKSFIDGFCKCLQEYSGESPFIKAFVLDNQEILSEPQKVWNNFYCFMPPCLEGSVSLYQDNPEEFIQMIEAYEKTRRENCFLYSNFRNCENCYLQKR